MKQTFRLEVSKHGGFLGGIDYDKWCNVWEEGFRGQEVTITVETVEKEKPKVKMCDCGEGCAKPAAWLTKGDGGTWHHCNEHLWRAMNLHCEGTYKITPLYLVPPQPPEPEKEKPKVAMCGSYSDDDVDKDCHRPAQWKIVSKEDGREFRCNAHVWRCLRGAPTIYTIEAIMPEEVSLPWE